MTHRDFDFEKSLKMFFTALSYDSLTKESILNKIALMLGECIPVVGISLSAYHKGALYRIAEAGCLESAPAGQDRLPVDEALLRSMEEDPRFAKKNVQYVVCDDPATPEFLKKFSRKGAHILYVPFGVFFHFPGITHMSVYISPPAARAEEYVTCCERFHFVLSFLTSFILQHEKWRFEGGELICGDLSAARGAPDPAEATIKTLEDVIKEHIQKALCQTDGRVAGKYGAADKLGLKPTTLWAKIHKYGIEMPRAGV